MRGRKPKVNATEVDAPKKERKPRRHMTAEEKLAAAKLRAENRKKADNLKPELVLQYQDCELNMEKLVEAAKDDFHKTKKRTPVTDLKIYIKPEDHLAYYVINGTYEGKVAF